MAEERNTRREILKKLVTLGPLAALAGAFGVNGAKPAEAADGTFDNLTANGVLHVNGSGNSGFAGNLGVGITSPPVILDVVGGDTAVWLEDPRSVFNGRGLPIQWRQKDYNSIGRSLGTMGTYVEDWTTAPDIKGYMAFRTMPNVASGDLERMRITSTGDVGIGTQTPVAKLDVVGDIRLTGSVLPVGGGVFEGKARRSCYDT